MRIIKKYYVLGDQIYDLKIFDTPIILNQIKLALKTNNNTII